MQDIVSVKKLTKKFGDITAVDRMDLTIREGEIYGLLGPNAAGKSTTINVLCGMQHKTGGEVKVFGKDITKRIREIKSDIGVVPQDIAIYSDLSAKENVRFFASLYGLKGALLKERTEEALEFVGLLERQKDLAKTFSGGMKRRLNIACAISHHPKLIIMDEPTVGIDPQSRNHILSSVKQLNEMGSTIIYTTHYMEEAEFLCERIGIIDHGKLIAEGTLSELQGIVADRKSIVITTGIEKTADAEALKKIKGVVDARLGEDNRVEVDVLKEADVIGVLVSELTAQGVPIRDIKIHAVNLETTFLSLTGRKLRD
ncbi:MAG: ABC transporter ATP-binding protein [Eubacteriales bacterium]